MPVPGCRVLEADPEKYSLQKGKDNISRSRVGVTQPTNPDATTTRTEGSYEEYSATSTRDQKLQEQPAKRTSIKHTGKTTSNSHATPNDTYDRAKDTATEPTTNTPSPKKRRPDKYKEKQSSPRGNFYDPLGSDDSDMDVDNDDGGAEESKHEWSEASSTAETPPSSIYHDQSIQEVGTMPRLDSIILLTDVA